MNETKRKGFPKRQVPATGHGSVTDSCDNDRDTTLSLTPLTLCLTLPHSPTCTPANTTTSSNSFSSVIRASERYHAPISYRTQTTHRLLPSSPASSSVLQMIPIQKATSPQLASTSRFALLSSKARRSNCRS
jgi:hypothetical protein